MVLQLQLSICSWENRNPATSVLMVKKHATLGVMHQSRRPPAEFGMMFLSTRST
ncbi:hypothetical protein AKJ16_DCAP17521 [Drosera capensis]